MPQAVLMFASIAGFNFNFMVEMEGGGGRLPACGFQEHLIGYCAIVVGLKVMLTWTFLGPIQSGCLLCSVQSVCACAGSARWHGNCDS